MDISLTDLRALLPVLALLPSVQASALEEPEFEIVAEFDTYEIRRYAPYLVAEVSVTGEFRDAGNAAFRILADYIFGENRRSEEMNMTAPVSSRQADGERMKMTAPVASRALDEQRYVYSFVMEQKYTLETLPKPLDPRVSIRRVDPGLVAARRFPGRWTERNYERNEAILLASLATDNRRTIGSPLFATYNPPFTPWFLRRNEVLIEVEPQPAG